MPSASSLPGTPIRNVTPPTVCSGQPPQSLCSLLKCFVLLFFFNSLEFGNVECSKGLGFTSFDMTWSTHECSERPFKEIVHFA